MHIGENYAYTVRCFNLAATAQQRDLHSLCVLKVRGNKKIPDQLLEIIEKGTKNKPERSLCHRESLCVPRVLCAVLVPSISGRIQQKKSVKMVIRRTEKGFLHEQRLNTLKSSNSGKGKFEGKSVKSPCKHHGDEELGTTRSCLSVIEKKCITRQQNKNA